MVKNTLRNWIYPIVFGATLAVTSGVVASVPQIETTTVVGCVATIYNSTDEMFAAADLVVVGRFTGNQIAVPTSQPFELRERTSIEQVEPGHLDSEFQIAEGLKGDR